MQTSETMKLLFVSIFCLVPLINSRSIKGRETDTCIADYLKNVGLLDSRLGSNVPPSALCSAIVGVTKDQILQGVRLEVLSDKEMRKEVDCIMDNLKNSDFGNNLLLMYVYETADGIEEAERSEKLRQTQAKVTRTTFDSFIECEADSKFGDIFDALLKNDSSSEEDIDPKEDYCIRKHIIENKLIDDHLNLPLNPKNLDTSNIDCTILYAKSLKDAEDELVKALLDDDSSSEEDDSIKDVKVQSGDVPCLMNLIRQGNYIDRMLQFDYVKELNLSAAKKTEMRDKFITVMTKLAQNTSKCFL